MKHFNKLTPPEAERLAILAEECAEAIQVVGKILRHGYESRNPDKLTDGTNRDQLTKELGDVKAALQMLATSCDVNAEQIAAAMRAKLRRMKKYLHHNGPTAPKKFDHEAAHAAAGYPDNR